MCIRDSVPDVEVLRRVVLGQVVLVQLAEREAVVDPGQKLLTRAGAGGGGLKFGHGSVSSCSAGGCEGASGLLRFADEEAAVGEIHVRRHLEVVGRGLVLED